MNDKWGRRLFVAGAVVLILLGSVHSLSLFQKPSPANETERQLFDLMSSYRFNLLGSMRSADDLDRGFSISFVIGMLGLGVLDLVLARERSLLLKRVAGINIIWLAALTVVSLRYFFVAPTAFVIAALLMFSLASLLLSAVAG